MASATTVRPNAALKALNDGCRCITEDETLRYSSALRTDGDPFSKLGRLYKWLAGDYNVDDFEQSADADTTTSITPGSNAQMLGKRS